MQVAGMDAAMQELLDSLEGSIVSGRTTDSQATRLFLALIADRLEKLTLAVGQLGEGRGGPHA
jgi:hypothetical protein